MGYQKLVGCSRRTAARDLDDMHNKGIIQRQGAGRSAYYVYSRNRAINLPIVPSKASSELSEDDASNRAVFVPNVPPKETKRTTSTSKHLKKDTKENMRRRHTREFMTERHHKGLKGLDTSHLSPCDWDTKGDIKRTMGTKGT